MTDHELLKRMKQNKNKGLAVIIDIYSGLVYKIVSAVILPVGTKEDAEECVSDVFLTFYNHIDDVDLSKATVKGYLAVIAKRRAIDFYRKLKKQNESLDFTDGITEPMHENVGISAEDKAELMKALKALGEPDCTIVKRKYILGETAREIGAHVNLSAEAVQKRLERSLVKLKIMMGGAVNG